MSEAKRIDDLLESSEKILWEDRVREPGTRSSGATLWQAVVEGWGVLFGLVFIAIAAFAIWAFIPLVPKLFIAALGLACFGFSASIFTGLWKERRFFQTAQLDYVLTTKRLIARNDTDQWSGQVFPAGLAGLARTGRNLDLYLKEPDEPLTLFDLADAESAEAIIAKTLGPL